MKIPVNKNIDVYKEDFFKGLTMRECLCALLTVLSGTGIFFVSYVFLHLPQEAALYCALPVSFCCASAGFLKVSGMSPLRWIHKRALCVRNPLYVYTADAVIPDRKLPEEHRAESADKKRKKQIWLEGEEGCG